MYADVCVSFWNAPWLEPDASGMHHDGIFEGLFLGYAGDCDPQVYDDVVTGCWSAFVALPVQTPWIPVVLLLFVTLSKA
jgi:hypothetical protein